MATCSRTVRPAAALAETSNISSVPEFLKPLSGLLNFNFSVPQLQKVQVTVDQSSQTPIASVDQESFSAKNIIEKYASAGGKGCVTFVVRRPG